MTDTTVSVRQIDGTSSTLSNTVLEEVLQANLEFVPLPEYTEVERKLAADLFATNPAIELPGTAPKYSAEVKRYVRQITDNGHRPLNDFVMPYVPSDDMSPGSTDVGDVSWLTPTAQFTAVTCPSGTPGHSWQNVSVGKTGVAHKGMLLAGKVLAGACADLMEDPSVLERARREFDITAADGYDCPLGPEVKPIPAV